MPIADMTEYWRDLDAVARTAPRDEKPFAERKFNSTLLVVPPPRP